MSGEEDKINHRKVKLYKLTSQLLLQVLSGGLRITNLPGDSIILAVNYDHECDEWALRIYSEMFPMMPEGSTLLSVWPQIGEMPEVE